VIRVRFLADASEHIQSRRLCSKSATDFLIYDFEFLGCREERRIAEEIETTPMVANKPSGLQLILKTCRCSKISPNVSDVVEGNSCLGIPPDTYYGGSEEYRVIGFRESDYKKMFHKLSELGPVEILEKRVLPEKSLRDTFAISMSSVFSELTNKQFDSIVAALEHGYYQIPKKATAEEIALKHHTPRTTFEEHLRKAESKILRSIAPYVRLYAASDYHPGESVPEIAAR
jgi:predicted DNA binding protein